MKIVEVTWLDGPRRTKSRAPREVELGSPNKTVGYLVREDKNAIVIAMEYWPEGEIYRNKVTIPKADVKRVRNVGR